MKSIYPQNSSCIGHFPLIVESVLAIKKLFIDIIMFNIIKLVKLLLQSIFRLFVVSWNYFELYKIGSLVFLLQP